ncbi:LytR C-terminal domain-containing protein [Nocardioides antri]|uniref:LytR family transcriptional regulator n=1 Tax=Nocardioides antri TaxID=2607659 RepID=A0A5B1LY88_9ACTN|nr:LytR C-terminal domain-containing protein [Nocardioides antri]KAA1425935.1 LytR family transcriptional regulator [Nocardioides antri]
MNGRPSPDQNRPSGRSRRDQRGAVLPSPVVLLSIVAVVVAAVAFVVTRDEAPNEREITTSSVNEEPSATQTTDDEVTEPSETETPEEPKKTKPPVERGEVGVVVFNNTSITGLASEVLAQVDEIGWNAVAADNWYGTIPATTVYFPQGMRDAAQKLALDLGVQRIIPADAGMSDTNLTVILTGALA